SGVRDFLADNKWPEYRAFCDHFYFAVDADFPQEMIPTEAGLVVAAGMDAEILRDAPLHAVPAARRRSLLHRFAMLGATRLAALEDPAGFAALRSALRAE
ncbi:MAG: MmcB family DNA repair protein, partial [Acetobacteraceae bacterium]|nr:MmcB family DNA repair protein [Acetobacteraceae bacterium]